MYNATAVSQENAITRLLKDPRFNTIACGVAAAAVTGLTAYNIPRALNALNYTNVAIASGISLLAAKCSHQRVLEACTSAMTMLDTLKEQHERCRVLWSRSSGVSAVAASHVAQMDQFQSPGVPRQQLGFSKFRLNMFYVLGILLYVAYCIMFMIYSRLFTPNKTALCAADATDSHIANIRIAGVILTFISNILPVLITLLALGNIKNFRGKITVYQQKIHTHMIDGGANVAGDLAMQWAVLNEQHRALAMNEEVLKHTSIGQLETIGSLEIERNQAVDRIVSLEQSLVVCEAQLAELRAHSVVGEQDSARIAWLMEVLRKHKEHNASALQQPEDATSNAINMAAEMLQNMLDMVITPSAQPLVVYQTASWSESNDSDSGFSANSSITPWDGDIV